MYISAYRINVKMKVTIKISETYFTYFSPNFNIKIFSIKHFGLILPLYWGKNPCEYFDSLPCEYEDFHSVWQVQALTISGLMCAQEFSTYLFQFLSWELHSCVLVGTHLILEEEVPPLWFPFSVLWPEIS